MVNDMPPPIISIERQIECIKKRNLGDVKEKSDTVLDEENSEGEKYFDKLHMYVVYEGMKNVNYMKPS